MSPRDELLAAIEAGDHMAVRRPEWGEVWEILATANAPRQGCTLSELKPYAKLLGNEDPAAIVAALEACAGEFRPTAGELRAYLNRRRGEGHRVDVGRGRDRRRRRRPSPRSLTRSVTAARSARVGRRRCAPGARTRRTCCVVPRGTSSRARSTQPRTPGCSGRSPHERHG